VLGEGLFQRHFFGLFLQCFTVHCYPQQRVRATWLQSPAI
jgi:hypothetical protein